jgi:hypothetical protein
MRLLCLLLPALIALGMQAASRDIPIATSDIANVEAIGSDVDITFSPDSQNQALADDRELSIHLDFPLPVGKFPFISGFRYVAHRLAAISFALPSPEHARQFAEGVRAGRVRFASHPKGSNQAMQPTASPRTASLLHD